MIFHQRHHQESHCTGGGRNHRRTSAKEGHNERNTERRVEAHLGINTGDNGKGDRFWNECERDNNTGQNVTTDVTQPVLTRRGQQHSNFSVFRYSQPWRATFLRTVKHIRRRDVIECVLRLAQYDRGRKNSGWRNTHSGCQILHSGCVYIVGSVVRKNLQNTSRLNMKHFKAAQHYK